MQGLSIKLTDFGTIIPKTPNTIGLKNIFSTFEIPSIRNIDKATWAMTVDRTIITSTMITITDQEIRKESEGCQFY